ncbi:MAG: acyl-CoA/acyl-ACP dehydrogenase [Deltaproteobacteria bacterium]|nr:acyl-CoA/acyl-ACP dehydrogenase [Deltaproteobacteria bacterium]
MNFAFSDEQEAFRAEIRRFLAERSPMADVRRAMEGPDGFDASLWQSMAQELGLPGIAIAEAHDGQGFGPLELGIVQEEMGRALVCAPFFSTACLATPALVHVGNEADHAKWLPRIAAGECTATLAWLEPERGWGLDEVALAAQPEGDAFVLEGQKRFAVDGVTADLVLVVARAGDGLGLFAVESGATGLKREALAPLDATRRYADLELDGVRAVAIGEPGAAQPCLERALSEAATQLSLECLGGAQACLDMAVAYAKQRVQFARPIASFQAIKHKCADMLLELECARAAAYWAAWACSENDAELLRAASLAKSLTSETYMLCAAGNIQIHGGIGVTHEADPSLFYKRARASEELLGGPAWHRARIAADLGI